MADTITSPPPADVIDELSLMRAALGHVIPAKSPGNLLVGTWNIRDFDRVSPTWRSATGKSPIRDLSNVLCIAEIGSARGGRCEACGRSAGWSSTASTRPRQAASSTC
jgi:hypothetical protein